MNIIIKVIPHNKQKYSTVGDWRFDKKGDLQIKVSDMGNWQYESAIAVHEMMEALLCKDRKVTAKEVDIFDANYEKEKKQGLHSRGEEPGVDKKSPYRKEHLFATKMEKMIIKELDVDWERYDKKIAKKDKF